MPKTTAELIEECLKMGGDFYFHLSNALWGVCNENTRRKAKSVAFGYQYGRQSNVDYAGLELAIASHFVSGSQRQAEDRMHRAGTITYKIRVFRESDVAGVTCGGQGLEDLDTEYTDYTVVAQSELDARCLAFVLDGGCEPGLTNFDDGHVELALTWTEVI
jgi:hypothetical protein